MRDKNVEERIKLEVVERNGLDPVCGSPTDDEKLQPNLRGDMWNFLLLTLLYLLQTIPIRMAMAMPIVLQSRGVSAADQGTFSLAYYPWNMKILWAPLVDLIYWKKLGRRKSWIVPTQYLLGIVTLFISLNIDDWIPNKRAAKPYNILMLTITFSIANALSAIQDVAVDGWSLTILKKENVCHASTCNSIANCISTILGYVLFIVMDSKDFCNKWLRSTPQETGLLSFSSYILVWSVVYFMTTTLILIFKKEDSFDVGENKFEIKTKLVKSYVLLWTILKIKPVQLAMLIFITNKIGIAPALTLGPLRLVDAGYTTVTLALLMGATVPFKCILLLVSNRSFVGEKCLSTAVNLVLLSIILGVFLTMSIYFIPKFREGGEILWWYSIIIFIAFCSHQIWQFLFFVSIQACMVRSSDPRYGGTYITVLTTSFNLGHSWLTSLSYFLLDFSTVRKCNTTGSMQTEKCPILIDGFYIEVLATTIIGLLWVVWARKIVSKLHRYSRASWLVEYQSANTNNS